MKLAFHAQKLFTTGRLAQLLHKSLSVGQVWVSNSGPGKSDTMLQSRHQSSQLMGAKRLSGWPKFEIKHKSRCLQKRKLVIGGGGKPPLSAGPSMLSTTRHRCGVFLELCCPGAK